MKRRIAGGTVVALCVLTAVATFNVTLLACRQGFNRLLPSYAAQQEIYGKLGEVKQIVDEHYVGTYDTDEALDMAATGFVVGVGDRWSGYLSEEEYQKYKLSFDGQLVGIGVSVLYDEKEDRIRITDVYEGSPAEKAGLVRGDEILGADEKSVAKDGYQAVVSAVGGKEGSKVAITVRHENSEKSDTISLVRKKVDKVVVRGEMLGGNIGYIRIRDFEGGADTQFDTALQQLLDAGAEKLIFDVRFNPGGSVRVMTNMLDKLLPEGTIITLKPKGEQEGEVFTSDADAIALPMAVIVNADSISAAEFFPAALQEYEKAIIVGEKTIGKGYSQRQYELSDGSALILSDQMYYTPKGKNLADSGIVPDVKVALSPDRAQNFEFLNPQEDDQLQAAIAAVNSK